MRTLLPCLIAFVLYLVCERIALNRSRRRISLCIAVTGTRGKSSVVRLLSSILRQDGRRVLAKTTGSQAVILLPDGAQTELDRSVTPSILEQKQLVHRAARQKADCLIAEVMSIHPENHYVESHHILRPNIIALTNVRRDHTEAMGETEDAIASVLSLDICAQSLVFLPEKELRPPFRAEAQRCNAEVVPVRPGSASPLLQIAPELSRREYPDNLDLVYAVASHLGIGEQKIINGLREAQHDIGRLAVWICRPDGAARVCYLASAFAANDPESTFQALSRVMERIPAALRNVIGILNLRGDRVPRTAQWIAALRDGGAGRFQRLFVTGPCSALVRRRLPEVRLLKAGTPEDMMNCVLREAPDQALIFGFGNIKGSGRLLVDYWNRIGEQYGI